MADQGTLNEQTAATTPTPAGAPSTPKPDTGEMRPTLFGRDHNAPMPGGEKATPSSTGDAKSQKASEPGKDDVPPKPQEEAKDQELERFDKHPRFQELNRRMKEAESRTAKAEEELQALRTSIGTSKEDGGKKAKAELPFRDLSQMKPEEVLEWQQEKPHEYYQNILAQARYEAEQDIRRSFDKERTESAVESTYSSFAEKHPDFDEMWDRQEIQRFMDRNPGHNAISAYLLMTSEKRQEEAIKAARKEWEQNLRAKRESAVLTSGPSPAAARAVVNEIPPEMKESKKYGGATAVLARRAAERARARGGV